jgi:hypothetical protein
MHLGHEQADLGTAATHTPEDAGNFGAEGDQEARPGHQEFLFNPWKRQDPEFIETASHVPSRRLLGKLLIPTDVAWLEQEYLDKIRNPAFLTGDFEWG